MKFNFRNLISENTHRIKTQNNKLGKSVRQKTDLLNYKVNFINNYPFPNDLDKITKDKTSWKQGKKKRTTEGNTTLKKKNHYKKLRKEKQETHR